MLVVVAFFPYNRSAREKTAEGGTDMVLKGIIVYGKQLGRTLGFPTANLDPDTVPEVMPENGVYAGWFCIEETGQRLPCVLNQGKHPTLPEGAPTIEVHILDFVGDIYGCEVYVEYVEFLRGEVRFSGLEELKAQIARDIESTRNIIK